MSRARFWWHLTTLAGGIVWAAAMSIPVWSWWVVVVFPYGAGVAVEAIRDLDPAQTVARRAPIHGPRR